MYIEQLTEMDLNNFANGFNCNISKFEESINNRLYVQLFTGAMGPQPELWLSDFDLKTSVYYQYAQKQLKKQYIQFMHNKFGENYKQDYTANFNQQIEEDRIL